MRRLALLIALLMPTVAVGGGGGLQAVKQRFLPAAQAHYANTPDGAQARYDAGRDLVEAVVAVGPVGKDERALRGDLLGRGRAQVARAEALDRDTGFRSLGPLAALPPVTASVGPRRPDATLASGSPPRPSPRTGRSGSGCTTWRRAGTPATRRRPASRPPPR